MGAILGIACVALGCVAVRYGVAAIVAGITAIGVAWGSRKKG